MKIAFIGGRTFHHPDGIATFMKNLATELVTMGHEPIVYQESDHNGTEIVNGFKVVHQKSYKSAALTKILLGFKATLKALFKEKGVQVFHYNCGGPAMIASFWPRLFGRISLIQFHGLEFNRSKYSPRKQKLVRMLFCFDCKMNKHLTAVSQEQTDYIREHFHKYCRTIKCAVNLPEEEHKSNVLERFGIKPNNYIVFMGRHEQDKNPDYLIRGFMASEHGDKQLVICGCAAPGSDFEEKLHEIAKSDKNVIFTGAIFDADKDTIFRNAWAFCLPSTMEGLPISLLEGMSYGKVCIASDIPANKEALGESGVWVKKEDDQSMTDALNDLYAHYNNYSSQGQVNLKRVKELFSWRRTAEEYNDFISSLANNQKDMKLIC